jgi:hypothetical protein
MLGTYGPSKGHFLDWAMADFSGYIAADELYDGPFCILSIVDNHSFKRLFQRVLEHDATQADVHQFFSDFRDILDTRGLKMHPLEGVSLGFTTDGSELYPSAISTLFPGVAHQSCQFHALANITDAVLYSVAKVRKELALSKPKLARGRPNKASRKLARKATRVQAKIADLFEYRYLFVQRHLTDSEHKTLLRITRGLPNLRTLRSIMDQVYCLFDRRCRTETALHKLAILRRRVQRFTSVGRALQTLFSPALERALTFLDEGGRLRGHDLLPATSNAVERSKSGPSRGHRRYRKMQNSVYRVRTHAAIIDRLALDLCRDMLTATRAPLIRALHLQRAAT